MLKKILIHQLIVLVVLSLSGCKSLFGPDEPQPRIMVKVKVGYNQNEMTPPAGRNHSDSVSTYCSWEGYSYHKMDKDEAPGWFVYYASDIEAPNENTPDTVYGAIKYRFRLYEPGFSVSDGAYINDKKIISVELEESSHYFVFWVNRQGEVRTSLP